MTPRPIPLITVIGPTASGKTDLGLEIAQTFAGEILSADSMQIYRGMDIGTAKPTPQELALVPHHLIDILWPDQPYNAGKFIEDAEPVIVQTADREKNIVLLGGTSLYIRALLHGIIDVPEISATIKQKIHELQKQEGLAGCYQKLSQLDPKSAQRLHQNDIARVLRALEVVMETGRSIQDFQGAHQFQKERFRTFYIGRRWEREELYRRINLRTLKMIESGLVEETEGLLNQGYSAELPSMKSIGYKQAVEYLNGDCDKDTMIRKIQQMTRRYAKKQLTWYRQYSEIHWLDGDQSLTPLYTKIQDFLK